MKITLESIAKHCIDDNITADQIAYLLKVQAELERLRVASVATPIDVYLADGRTYRVDGNTEKRTEMSVVKPPEGKTWLQCIVDGCPHGRLIRGMCAQCAGKEIERLRKEVKRLRNENVQIFTMVKCDNCERGVRQRYNVHGLCHLCARKEMTRLRGIEKAVTPQGLGFTREDAAEFWRLVAEDPCYWRGAVKVHGNMIADALDCRGSQGY